MACKSYVWVVVLLGHADIENEMTRHKLRALEKRFEQLNGTYQIGIPDSININVPDHPDLSGHYEVRPDGNISYPLLNDIYVEGLTPQQLGETLAKRLEVYVKKVEVLVTITGGWDRLVYSSRIRLVRDNPEGTKEVFRIRGDRMVRGDFSTNIMVKENDMVYFPGHIMAEIGFAVETLTYPLRSIVRGLYEAGAAPYEVQRGYQEYERREQDVR